MFWNVSQMILMFNKNFCLFLSEFSKNVGCEENLSNIRFFSNIIF